MEKKKIDLLFSKLRQPVHLNYISNYILREDVETTKKILQEFIDVGQIEESNYAKEYYVVSKKNL